ncbi:hypothetical protein INT44_005966 [Umbelopsis vinacea]|uniref:Uncharacterized protein n=1 Tax=Umbelopsis vinacea TaxID=44442 RepID=A0A8H7Q0C0_9FUNG|nr:hypothetical protein INT44_005966 [Umbelopsis vinacea]
MENIQAIGRVARTAKWKRLALNVTEYFREEKLWNVPSWKSRRASLGTFEPSARAEYAQAALKPLLIMASHHGIR